MAEDNSLTNGAFECSLCLESLGSPAPAPTETPPPTNMPGANRGRTRAQTSKKKTAAVINLSEVVTTKCGHLFHHACLLEWFKQKNSGRKCPICRKDVPNKNGLIKVFPNGSDAQGSASASEDDAAETDDEVTDTLHKDLIKEHRDLLKKYNEALAKGMITDALNKTLKEENEKLKRQIGKLEGSEGQSTSGEGDGNDRAKRSRTDDEAVDICKVT